MTGKPFARAASISALMYSSATQLSSPQEVRQRLIDSRIGSGLSPQNAQFTSMTNSAGRLPKSARAPKPPAANTALSRSVRNLFQTGSVIAFPPSSTHRRSREIPGTSPGRNPPQVPSRTLAPRFRGGDESNYSSDSDVAV